MSSSRCLVSDSHLLVLPLESGLSYPLDPPHSRPSRHRSFWHGSSALLLKPFQLARFTPRPIWLCHRCWTENCRRGRKEGWGFWRSDKMGVEEKVARRRLAKDRWEEGGEAASLEGNLGKREPRLPTLRWARARDTKVTSEIRIWWAASRGVQESDAVTRLSEGVRKEEGGHNLPLFFSNFATFWSSTY